MAYFSRFPIVARYLYQGVFIDSIDITKRTAISRVNKNDQRQYIDYLIKDGESPIVIADRMYDDVDLYWVILVWNNIFDEIDQWPLSEGSLREYVLSKYNDLSEIHHYESLSSGSIVDVEHPEYDRVSITVLEHETRINDNKRRIKVPVPDIVGKIKSEHNRLISQ